LGSARAGQGGWHEERCAALAGSWSEATAICLALYMGRHLQFWKQTERVAGTRRSRGAGTKCSERDFNVTTPSPRSESEEGLERQRQVFQAVAECILLQFYGSFGLERSETERVAGTRRSRGAGTKWSVASLLLWIYSILEANGTSGWDEAKPRSRHEVECSFTSIMDSFNFGGGLCLRRSERQDQGAKRRRFCR
jgi:hypothetical protein